MKLVRYGKSGSEKPGLIDKDGKLRDLSAHIEDIAAETMSQISKLKKLDPADLPLVSGKPRFGPCVGNIGKFMCIGLNYSDHAAESGSAVPAHPMLFMKANSAINGPNDTVSLPRKSKTTDWEVELAAVIGRKTKYVSEADALKYVAGYCIVNDVSERTFQKDMSGQFTKGKSCDTFGPIGPWLVTKDEVKDPQNLRLTMDLNGKRMQDGTTSEMIFTVAQIISHLSQMFTLHPGDVISTGTPAGVGMGMKPKPKFLKAGDTMELSIEGLGMQRQKVKMDK
ncbi:MAG: fumarylacetoacetate hydrolase family protein [Rhizobiaceae bacterium]|nr:fumarylacetoacetate hydrolase family protein [Rhizobiaceae bacterium]